MKTLNIFLFILGVLSINALASANEDEAINIFDRYMDKNGYFYSDYKGKYEVIDFTKPNIYSVLLRAKKKSTGTSVNICGVIMVKEPETSRRLIAECFPSSKEDAIALLKPKHALLLEEDEADKRRGEYEKPLHVNDLPKPGSIVQVVDVLFGKEKTTHKFPGGRSDIVVKYYRTSEGKYVVKTQGEPHEFSIKDGWILSGPKNQKFMPTSGKIGDKIKTPAGQIVEFVPSVSLYNGPSRKMHNFKGPCILLTTPRKSKFDNEVVRHYCAPFGKLETGENTFDVGSYMVGK